MELSFDGVDLVPYKCNCCNGIGFVDDGYIDVTEKRNCFSCNGKGIKYEFYGPGRCIADLTHKADRSVTDLLPQIIIKARRRGLLDNLLVASLDRAFPLKDVCNVSLLVGDNLNLDMPAAFDILLDEQFIISKGLHCL